MGYGDLQIFDIIVFAVIAVFLIFRLRSVLGKRTGFEKTTNNNTNIQPINTEVTTNKMPELEENISKLSIAYETINILGEPGVIKRNIIICVKRKKFIGSTIGIYYLINNTLNQF